MQLRAAEQSDLDAMKALVRELWSTRVVECLPADLDWRAAIYLDGTWPASTITLCEDEGRLRGFAWRIKDTMVDIVAADREAADHLISGDGTHYAHASNEALRAAYAAKGLKPAGHDYLTFARDLQREHPRPWPPGYRLTTMRDLDVEARAALHRAAFASERMTTERYQRVMASELYDPTLDLVALSFDDEPAAFVIGWYDRALGVGLCEPVGTHPEHRGRGLAKVLMYELLARFAARGATQAQIGAAADDAITPKLYAGLGFTLIDRNLGHRA